MLSSRMLSVHHLGRLFISGIIHKHNRVLTMSGTAVIGMLCEHTNLRGSNLEHQIGGGGTTHLKCKSVKSVFI